MNEFLLQKICDHDKVAPVEKFECERSVRVEVEFAGRMVCRTFPTENRISSNS